ncbi:MAG: DeoR family transcriptional regulator [Anaerolineae bacterium]|nr:DeoR family transcriptional regulator [Anaerolineae bacterium]
MIPADRAQRILELLAQEGSVRVADLSQRLGVSAMTIHRDLDELEQRGQLRKVRGGAVPVVPAGGDEERCLVCGMRPRRRHQVLLRFADGSERRACCPHCGLLAIAHNYRQISNALVTDFLYERPIGARQATYVVAPQVSICCSPTVLAFEQRSDAERFQAGFGGQVETIEGAMRFLEAMTRVDLR